MEPDSITRVTIFLAVLSFLILPVAAADPYADFIATSVNGSAPLTVSFWDLSYNDPTSYMWNATDIITTNIPTTIGVSKNLTYTFNVAGNFSIQHIVTNAYGTNSTAANRTFVNVTAESSIPAADFTTANQTVYDGVPVQFTDLSTNNPTSWQWRTGPDSLHYSIVSTEQNPMLHFHISSTYGNTHFVELRASNSAGYDIETKNAYITVIEAPVSPIASFTPTGDLEGSIYVIHINTNTTIYFNDTSTAGTPTSWNWSFASLLGTLYSSEQNPTFEYNLTTASKEYPYTVTLTATNAAGSSTTTKYVVMEDPPITPIIKYDVSANLVSFNVMHGTPESQRISVYNGFNPALDHTVIFDDTSYNSPTALSWTIDAGNGSSYNYFVDNFEFDYGYATPGNYSVIHSATNDAGTDSLTMLTLVNVLDSVPPASISNIVYSNGSTAIKWNWTIPTDSDYSHAMVYRDGTFYENATGTGTMWTGLTPSTEYDIGTHAVDIYGNVNTTWVNSSSTTLVSSWEFTTCGMPNWTAPEGAEYITLSMIAGGGSGHPGYNTGGVGGGYYYGGFGGESGEAINISRIRVTPGTKYDFVVGCKGNTATYGTDSNSGTYSSAFGTSVTGGSGGLPKGADDTDPADGGDGENGMGSAALAINGTTTAIGDGGVAGKGRGASGGGGAANTTASPLSNGGAGADGYISVTVFGYASINMPDFVADRTTSGPGTLIHFTDISNITDTAGLTYSWTFGDGSNSSTVGDVQHVYPYTGSYDVSLTLTTSNGSATETKPTYINIVNEDGGKINTLYPQETTFTLVSQKGIPLDEVLVTATMTSSSIDNTTWWDTLFGVADSNINSTVLTGFSDDSGNVVFPMVASGRYHMVFSSTKWGVAESKDIHPSQRNYLYFLTTSRDVKEPDKSEYINVSLSAYPPATEHPATVYLIGNYTDTSSTTTSGSFYVRYPTNETIIYRVVATTPSSFHYQYAVSNVAGAEYVWGIDAVSSQFGDSGKAMGITLPGTSEYGLASNLVRTDCNDWACT